MEGIIEELVKRQKTIKDYILEVLIIIAGFVLTITLFALYTILPQAMPNFAGSLLSTLCFVLIFGVWYGVYNLRLAQSIEFEYSFINGSVDIDKIIAKKKRKRVVSFDIKDAELMARIDDDEHNSVYKNTPQGVSVINCTAPGNGEVYFVYVTEGNKRRLILISPSERMIEGLWKHNPSAVVHKR